MTDTMYRLLEHYQKLDTLIAQARRQRIADPIEIARLRTRKLRLREKLARLLPSATLAH
ncbi:hypothetical protein WSK_0692 [Novosphingobium sp. Rr 2-17]|uniref:DUF465 domain-containing protein n=1 Tax=Novosphingobium sp. Rr 2-17 TaxID=555793 RepID=UPI0002697B07|nr:DUF465 domain-containing protein [Novosphingobium sp. Rr 2-17]EIZ80719.1 hypothetical protein WSK_0692 [Novosphingobium sp. Rr 2-17]